MERNKRMSDLALSLLHQQDVYIDELKDEVQRLRELLTGLIAALDNNDTHKVEELCVEANTHLASHSF